MTAKKMAIPDAIIVAAVILAMAYLLSPPVVAVQAVYKPAEGHPDGKGAVS